LAVLWTLALLAATVTVPAEDAATQRAREEVEAQLAQFAQAPPPQLEVRFEGVVPDHYEAVETSFALDEQPLTPDGGVWLDGEVTPGEHQLTGSVLVKDKEGGRILSYAADYRFRVPFKVTLMAQRDLRLEVSLRVRGDDSVTEPGGRLKAEVKVDALMLGPAAGEQPEADADEAPDAGGARGAFDGGKAYTKMKTGNWKKKAKAKKARPYTKMKTGEWASADAPKTAPPKKVGAKKASLKKATPKKPARAKVGKADAGT
jgi:hypothetical protein